MLKTFCKYIPMLLLVLASCSNSGNKTYEILGIYSGRIIIDNNAKIITNSYDDIIQLNNNKFLLKDTSLWLFNANNKSMIKLPYENWVTFDSIFPNFVIFISRDSSFVYDKNFSLKFKTNGFLSPFNYKYFYIENSSRTKVGIIDTNGIICLPLNYSYIYEFTDINKYCFLNSFYHYSIEKINCQNIETDILALAEDSIHYLYNKKTKSKISKDYDMMLEYPDNLILVKKNDKYGFIDKSGKEIIKCTYDDVGEINYNIKTRYVHPNRLFNGYEMFHDKELYWYYINELGYTNHLIKVSKSGKWGIINTQGNTVLPFIYNDLRINDSNHIAAKIGNKWQFLDLNNKKTISPKFKFIKDYNENFAFVKLNEKWDIFDFKILKIIKREYDKIREFSSNGSIVMKNERYKLVNKYGEEISREYDGISECSWITNMYFCKINNSFLLMNNLGKEVCGLFDEISPIEFGNKVLFVVRKNGYGGLIDSCGNIVINMLPYISDFYYSNNSIRAIRNVAYNYQGEEIIELRKYVDTVTQFNFYHDPKIKNLVLGTFVGLIDSTGKELIPCNYKGICVGKSFITGLKYLYTDIYDKNYKLIKRIKVLPTNEIEEIRI